MLKSIKLKLVDIGEHYQHRYSDDIIKKQPNVMRDKLIGLLTGIEEFIRLHNLSLLVEARDCLERKQGVTPTLRTERDSYLFSKKLVAEESYLPTTNNTDTVPVEEIDQMIYYLVRKHMTYTVYIKMLAKIDVCKYQIRGYVDVGLSSPEIRELALQEIDMAISLLNKKAVIALDNLHDA